MRSPGEETSSSDRWTQETGLSGNLRALRDESHYGKYLRYIALYASVCLSAFNARENAPTRWGDTRALLKQTEKPSSITLRDNSGSILPVSPIAARTRIPVGRFATPYATRPAARS